jgi:hypothetical protein
MDVRKQDLHVCAQTGEQLGIQTGERKGRDPARRTEEDAAERQQLRAHGQIGRYDFHLSHSALPCKECRQR